MEIQGKHLLFSLLDQSLWELMQPWSESMKAVNCAVEIRHNQADDGVIGFVEGCC